MYLLIVSVLFNLFVINSAQLTDRGEFDWKKSGSTVKSHIAGGNGGVTVASSGSVTLLQQYQPRVYVMDPTTTTNYYRFPDLTGNTIQFTVDLSQTSNGCNTAFYLVQMPSSYTAGQYCDAQCPSGACCVELDLMEANTVAFQATAHWGDGSTNGKNGCAWNVKSAQGYGKGGSAIDTSKPYTVAVSFTKSSSGTLNGMAIKLSQSGKSGLSTTITDSSCTYMTSNYISSLAGAVKSGQMVGVASFWSSVMTWLDGTSSNNCASSQTTTISSLQFISGVTAIASDETSEDSGLPFVQSPLFIGIMCAITILLLVGIIAVILIKRKNALNQEIV